jgi:predicted PurR-regulated permease PerM
MSWGKYKRARQRAAALLESKPVAEKPVAQYSSSDLTRTTLAVLFLGGLIAASFWILRPFLGAIVWAIMIVVPTWPLMLRIQARLRNRRGYAVAVMTLGLLLVLVVPLTLAIGTIVDNADVIVGWAKSLAHFSLPPPPDWVGNLPVVGTRMAQAWEQAAASGMQELAARAAPYAGNIAKWFAAQMGGVGLVLVQFLLTVMIAGILYATGERAAAEMRRFGRRLAGERGENAVRLAAQAIRGVALGVVVTALAQSLLGWIGLAISGVPFAALLTGLMFFLCIAQVGPTLVLAPAVIWLYWTGETVSGTVLLVFAIIAGTIDNFLRPLLIKMGADLPLLLIFAGVIGGLISFGLIGIFVGPVVLAVAYTLLQSWLADVPVRGAASAPNSAAVAGPDGTPDGGGTEAR